MDGYVSIYVYHMCGRKMKATVKIHLPHTAFDMEPGEEANMSVFDAFELTHAGPHSV